MKNNEELRQKLCDFFKDDIYATETTGIEIDAADENYALCSMKIEKKHLNANGFVMGGAIFTLADFAFAVAANSEGNTTVSVSSSISYLNPGKGNKLFAEAVCEKSGRRSCTFIITVRDDSGKKVALVTTGGMRV